MNKIKQNYGGQCIQGINDINTKVPWMVTFLKNKEDTYNFAWQSGKKITFKCPNCGCEQEKRVQDVSLSGFSCPVCGDGISRPNKFARNVLLQLPLDNLQFEYTADWTQGKRYDNYFEYQNNKYVLEIDGDQHNTDSGWDTYVKQQQNDAYKDKLAKDNNIIMIRINTPFKKYNDWIDSFKNEPILFNKLLLDYPINWTECIENTETSLIKKVCEYYNEHKDFSTTQIGEKFKLDRHTILRYLQTGTKIGFCNYSIEQANKQKMDKIREERLKDSHPIIVEDLNHNILYTFDRIGICIEQMNKMYPTKTFNISGIIHSCTRYNKSYNNFYFYYKNVDIIEEYYKKKDVFYKVCKCFADNDNYLFADEIKDILKINTDRTLINSYLEVGTLLGLCNYSKERMDKKRMDKTHANTKNISGVQLNIYDNENNLIGTFNSIREASKELPKLYPSIGSCSEKGMGKAINKDKTTNTCFYKGLKIERLS